MPAAKAEAIWRGFAPVMQLLCDEVRSLSRWNHIAGAVSWLLLAVTLFVFIRHRMELRWRAY